MFLLKCLFLNLLILQSTQVFANRALDRAVAADGLRTGYYNPNPAHGRIPGQTNIVLEEFSKRPSSETANPTQKKQMAQAMMRTAAIHSRFKDAAYQQVGATQRDLDHFTCMRIIRNVSNYLIGNMITNKYSDWGDFGTVQGIVSSLVDSNVSKNLTDLQRLAGITPENFTDWFVEAVCSLKDGLNKSTAWYWRDQEERAASASASSAGGGGVQAGAGGRSLGASEDGEGFFGGGPQPRAAAVAHDTITDQRGNQLPLHGDQGVYTVFKNSHELVREGVIDKQDVKVNIQGLLQNQLKSQLTHQPNFSDPKYLNDLYAKLSAIYAAEHSAPVVHAPAPLPAPAPRAGLKQAGAGGIPDHIVDLHGNQISLRSSDSNIGIYTLFENNKKANKLDVEIRKSLGRYISKLDISKLVCPSAPNITADYLEDLYAKLSRIYAAEQAAPPPAPVHAQVFASPPPALAAAPRPGAGGRLITMDHFTYTGEIGKNFNTIIAAYGDPSLTIMGVYDPTEPNIHSQYGQLTEIGMRLAFIDWEASQLNKPKHGYLGADAGFYVFRIEGRMLPSGERELVSTTDLPPQQKQHMTAETFYQNAERAFAKGFNSYAGVVRSSSLRSGHFFTLFVRKEADGTWEVFAINPLGKPESLLSVTAEVLTPFVTHLTSKGIRIKTQEAVATGFQMRNETCGIWATLIARTLCDVGSIEGLNKFYDLLVSTDASMQSLANINRAVAQDIGLADVVKYRTLRLLAEEKINTEAILVCSVEDELREARRQIAALTSSINAVEQELAKDFGPNYQQVLAAQKDMVEQKLFTMEKNFAEYYAGLLQEIISFSQRNQIDFGRRAAGMTHEDLEREDARVAPGIQTFHNNFVQYLAAQKALGR